MFLGARTLRGSGRPSVSQGAFGVPAWARTTTQPWKTHKFSLLRAWHSVCFWLALAMRVCGIWHWVLGAGLVLAGSSLNPQPIPPANADAGATFGDGAALSSDGAGGGVDSGRGIDSGSETSVRDGGDGGDGGLDAPVDVVVD